MFSWLGGYLDGSRLEKAARRIDFAPRSRRQRWEVTLFVVVKIDERVSAEEVRMVTPCL
jgi:hypothetical protein